MPPGPRFSQRLKPLQKLQQTKVMHFIKILSISRSNVFVGFQANARIDLLSPRELSNLFQSYFSMDICE